LDGNSPDLIDALFCEAELPVVNIPYMRCTPQLWSIIFRLFWLVGVSKNAESVGLFKQRVSLASAKLEQLVQEHETVLLVGHGVLNRFLAKQLLATGWVVTSASNTNPYFGYRYWEYTVFSNV
jgi:broad specificity phosphatase PhoE